MRTNDCSAITYKTTIIKNWKHNQLHVDTTYNSLFLISHYKFMGPKLANTICQDLPAS